MLFKYTKPRNIRIRQAALLCAALAGLGLAGRTDAQTGPVPAPYTSPPVPTPFQSPLFHSGGGPVPASQYPLDAANAPYLTPLIDPLQGQGQGTPTEYYPAGTGTLTQIPSFLLGNYDPARPPAGLTGGAGTPNVFFPNHFRDGSVFSWAAPFIYTTADVGTVTVDDTGAVAPSAFTTTGGWVSITTALTGPSYPSAGTAANSEYLRLPSGTAGTATWTLAEPTAGNYSLYFTLPNDLPDSNGVPEARDTQVTYQIVVKDASGATTATTQATASQTEANDPQFLAGPFSVAANGTVTVTLTRRSTPLPVLNNGADFLVADSMILQAAVGDVQSAPTAITYDLYPNEFNSTTHPLQYWGTYVTPGGAFSPAPSATATPAQQAITTGNPDTDATNGGGAANAGNILLETGSPTLASTPSRRIRQLVYFGRSEPATNRTSTVDDSAAAPRFVSGAAVSTAVTDATATAGEYKSYAATTGTTAATLAATWTLPSPSTGGGPATFVSVRIPETTAGETRLPSVFYTVTVGTATYAARISQVNSLAVAATVTLPTGPLFPAVGSNIIVRMYTENGLATAPAAGTVVVADSATATTASNGQGAIYCVDGFTGAVVWRYETPGSANGPSAPVFGSPIVAKINVLVTPAVAPALPVYENRLVVIVADNNGLVYCLDAIGNGDGTSNFDVLAKDTAGNPIPGQPVIIPQPAYGTTPPKLPLSGTTSAAAYIATPGNVHVGTTGVLWIYRPDAFQPKYITGANIGKVKPVDPTTDLPVPASFATASPNVFVDPTVSTTPSAAGVLASNAIVYVGGSNGVLYALDALGNGIDATTAATIAATGDPFNVTQDTKVGAVNLVPTPKPLWWFSLRGANPNGASNSSNADIESAPALYVHQDATTKKYLPTVYIGSAHEQEVTSNVGRLYALDGLYGPSFNGGVFSPVPTAANYAPPGSFNYNVGQRPQLSKTDTAHWSFPDAVGADTYATGKSSSGKPRPALGNITGSPVVFTNVDETGANPTRVYIAANSGQEYPLTARPDDTQTGRLWAVNLDGSLGTTTGNTAHSWVYPLAYDPNDATKDATAEPYAPIGSFLRSTPAIGFVQFPATTTNGDGTAYNPVDSVHTAGISGQKVPMLYVGTRGNNDKALYAVNIDGDMTAGGTPTDTRTVYRVPSPNGSIFQSSPALVTNATTSGGNGGSIYAIAGETLYDYQATPISNPFAGQAYPIVSLNRKFVGVGAVSSPALAGANVVDINNTGFTNTAGTTANTTDWIYVGDSGSGVCRGITPYDLTYGGIPTLLNGILPYNPQPVEVPPLDATIKTFLVKSPASASTTDPGIYPVGPTAPLPVYEWGETASVRFTNVVPPNPANASGQVNPNLFVHDTKLYTNLTTASTSNPIPFYTSDGTSAQTVTFNLSDAGTTGGLLDTGQVNPQLITTPPDGFVVDGATATPDPVQFPDVTRNLVANNGKHYLGTYSYTIADGSARNNTPGGRRQFQNVRQTVTEYDYIGGPVTSLSSYTRKGTTAITGDATGGNIVDNPGSGFTGGSFAKVAAVDQPTFGILNPLAVRGGGVSLRNAPHSAAVPVGEALGPFRAVGDPPTTGVTPSPTTMIDPPALQALANGNDIPVSAPPSSSGVGGSPVALPNAANGTDPTGIYTPTRTAVVVTTTGLIPHNTSGDNGEASTGTPKGTINTTNLNDGGLGGISGFGGYTLDVADRGALVALGQTLRVKMTVPTSTLYAPPAGRDGISWNSNFTDPAGPGSYPDNTGHDSVVNFLPWETPPTPYVLGTPNGSTDYPDIAPGNVALNLKNGGDLTSNYVALPQGSIASTSSADIRARKVNGAPVKVQVTVPHYQPPNQQLYRQANPSSQTYSSLGEIPPVNEAGTVDNTTGYDIFPMGYVTSKRIYVPNANGFYSSQRPYRDVRIYTGVPIDLRTSVATPAADIGKVPAAFGVQTENYPGPSYLFIPYNPYFAAYFKPLEVHNDGNVNLLNVHFDQKISNGSPVTLALRSDAADPLSSILGYDLNAPGSTYGITGPRSGIVGSGQVPEEPYLIRTNLDTDLVRTFSRNSSLPLASYPGATFHKPLPGSDQPTVLTLPDAPSSNAAYAVPNSTPPLVSLAVPFGTPVGTYTTAPAQDSASLRVFEGLDTAANYAYNTDPLGASPLSFLYPPKYGTMVGGIGNPTVDPVTGEPTDTSGVSEDIYNGGQPLSTTGTQLTGTVIEQRLTDGSTYGAMPMIDAHGAVISGGATPTYTSTPDFGPAAFRDPSTGNLSVYWASGRSGSYSLSGATLAFKPDPSTADPHHGYFLPMTPGAQWWSPFTPAVQTGAVNSGLTFAPGAVGRTTSYAFDVAVAGTAPYSNTLYSYSVKNSDGTLISQTLNQSQITPTSDSTQVKYGVRGLYYPVASNLYAFWTASTRGRTALYYSAKEANGNWPQTTTLLPVPAGLTSVADASPLLLPAVGVNTPPKVIEVTYSGTAPDGNTDLYVSRYLPTQAAGSASAPLSLVPFPAVTEDLQTAGGWYQARDAAWSRDGALNVSVTTAAGAAPTPLLYDAANKPLFTQAIYDKASGLLVLTGVKIPNGTGTTTNTVYVDAPTGRVRFSPGLLPAQNFTRVQATFSPLARRLTTDSRADTAPVTFIDNNLKPNDAPGSGPVTADRRWTIWRKAGIAGTPSSATLYFKTQRLTFFLPNAISVTTVPPVAPSTVSTYSVNVSNIKINGTDVTNQVDVDYSRGRLYFPIATGAEGQTVSLTYSYTDATGTSQPRNVIADPLNTVQWQDERLANDDNVKPADSAAGLSAVLDTKLPLDTAVNENNVAAFLDPFASATSPHKVWLFWNSTRNGTADIYSETIDPRFVP